jgi:hypothetical protein
MKTEAQKRANRNAKKKYKLKCKVYQLCAYPTDSDIIAKLERVRELNGGNYSPYIKALIRKDIKESEAKE